MLAEKTGVHKDQIRLIFKGKPMADEKVRKAHSNSATRCKASEHTASTTSAGGTRAACRCAAVSRPLLRVLCLVLASLLVQTLADQQVVAGSTVHMIMQMRGGC